MYNVIVIEIAIFGEKINLFFILMNDIKVFGEKTNHKLLHR